METHAQRIAHSHEAATYEPAFPVQPPQPAGEPPAPAAQPPGSDLVLTAPPPSEPAAFEPPAFEPVPLRYRHDGWTPARQRAFLEELGDCLSPAVAAARVGMSEQSAYALRRRTGAARFAAAWDAVLRHSVRRRVASFALERALNGTLVRRYYHGQLVAEERVHSERLLLALLARADKLFPATPETDSVERDWDGALAAIESGAPEDGTAEGYRVWRDHHGNAFTNFPPPDGFDGHEKGEPGSDDYERTLTEAEEAAVPEPPLDPRLVRGAAARDRYFGFKGGLTLRSSRAESRGARNARVGHSGRRR